MNSPQKVFLLKALAKWVSFLLCFMFAFNWYVQSVVLPQETLLTFEEQTTLHGYSVEKHHTTTSDGYLLSLFRIPSKGPPVLLIHGLSNSANCFILNICGIPPAYILASAGYDVWLGNLRGTYLSRNHTYLSSDSPEYWNYNVKELIEYDLPQMVHFVKQQTGYPKIAMLGHSQGAIAVLMALARQPHLSEEVSLAIAIGTPGGVSTTKSYYIRFLLSPLLHNFCWVTSTQVLSDWSDDLFFAKFVSAFPKFSHWIIQDLYDIKIVGGDPLHYGYYMHRLRGGVNLQTLLYWKQYYNNKLQNPKLYDFGKETNLEVYGSTEPPTVDFKDIQTKVAILNGKYDKAVPKEDSELLKKSINPKYLVHYNDQYEIDHGGFLFGCNMSYFQDVLYLLSSVNNC